MAVTFMGLGKASSNPPTLDIMFSSTLSPGRKSSGPEATPVARLFCACGRSFSRSQRLQRCLLGRAPQ